MNAEFSLPPDAKARQQMLDQKKAAEVAAAERESKPASSRGGPVPEAPAAQVQRNETQPVR